MSLDTADTADEPAIILPGLPDEPVPVVVFPAGLPGFPEARRFAVERPAGATGGPLLLRCLDDATARFFVLPLDPNGRAPADGAVAVAAATLGIAADDLGMLVIVTRRPGAQGGTLRANLRAPLLLDTQRRLGWQVVLAAAPPVTLAAA